MGILPDSAGVNFKAASHIYTFPKAVLTIVDPSPPSGQAGTACYALSSIQISLAENELPTMTLVIAPESFPLSVKEQTPFQFPSQKTVLSPPMIDFIQENLKLEALVRKDGVTAGLELQMVRSDGQETQTISFSNWVLAAAGVVQASAQGGWSVVVTIAHPAFLGSLGIGWLPNTANLTMPPKTTPAANIPAIFFQDLQNYSIQTYNEILYQLATPTSAGEVAALLLSLQSAGLGCGAQMSTVALLSHERLEKARAALEENIAWTTDASFSPLPFPIEKTWDVSYFARAMWAQLAGADSLWDQFVSQMAAYDLVITGGPYANPLLVKPFTPWGKPELVLYDREVWSVDLPAMNLRDIAGVVAVFDGGRQSDDPSAYYAKDSANAGQFQDSLPQQITALSGYACPAIATPPLYGPLVAISPPAWIREFLLDNAGGYAAGNDPLNPNNVNAGVPTTTGPAEAQSATPLDLSVYANAIQKYCKQVFLRTYRSGLGIGLGTRLLIQSPASTLPGNYVVPGIVARLDSVTENSGAASATPALYFYITSVTHNIDVAGNQAHTNLQGAFVRSPQDAGVGGFTAEDIANGIPNPIYAYGPVAR